jgi:hypothetical protein
LYSKVLVEDPFGILREELPDVGGYPRTLAAIDVISVHERPDLEGLKGPQLFPLLAGEQRAILTENRSDFQEEMRKAAQAGRDHYGVLVTSRHQLPRSKHTIGLYIRVVDDFLARHPDDDALPNSYRWLPEPGQPRLLD